MRVNRRSTQPEHAGTGVRAGASVGTSIRQWLLADHDYLWIVEHHSLRPIHRPMRAVFAANILLFAGCSLLLLNSPDGPSGTREVVWTIAVLFMQLVVVVLVVYVPEPTTQRQAQLYFVGFAIFGDVGLASVLVLYSPLVSAFGCALLALNSALCTYFVSSRWLLAHMVWSLALIGWTGVRVYDANLFDTYATIAGTLVMIAAVCVVPIVAHVAWTLLSVDARHSLRDPLTGLHNRRGVEASHGPLWATDTNNGTAFAAVVIDVDNFKRINDTFGHDVGDSVLQEISTRMLLLAGPTGVVGRTGGEEFTMLLTGPADEVEDRLRRLPDDLRDAMESATVTVSVGAAVIGSPEAHQIDTAMQTALRTADARMYAAKRSGGGRTCISTL